MRFAFHLLLFIAFTTKVLAAQSIGVTALNLENSDQTRPLTLSIWYPGKSGQLVNIGGNAVFNGVVARRDASFTKGKLPVILVSHGGLRSAADSGAWLSAALAHNGYLAVEINAPRPKSAAKAIDEIWHRPDDVSRALDSLLSDSDWLKRIDQSRIYVAGFALGGTAAIALAGVNFELKSFIKTCDEIQVGPDCAWYQAQNVSLDRVDKQKLVESRGDSRVSAFIAIAPEYVDVFSNRISMIKAPTLFVSLGSDNEPRTIEGDALMQTVFSAASVFDGFQTCTPAGAAILADEGGDPDLCGTSAKTRQQAHDQIVNEVLRFLIRESRQ